MKDFDAKTIELQGKNLIEASAGTGKTYSIGILVLRMILEKDIRIEQILMVTFTNAAVAELEIRIRKFLREAYKISKSFAGYSPENDIYGFCDKNKMEDPVYSLICKSVKEKGQQETERLLKNSILFLDETSIFTIHGFSQFTLSEFAFETGQLFNTEIIEDQEKIIEDVVNDFWRKNIITLDLKILKILMDKDFSRKKLVDFAKDIFNGKKLLVKTPVAENSILQTIKEKKNAIVKAEQRFEQLVKENWTIIQKIKTRSRIINKSISDNNIQSFVEKYITDFKKKEKDRPQYLDNFKFLFDTMSNIIQAENEWKEFETDIMVHFLDKSAGFLIKEVERRKNRNQMLSFYDLISKLHQELVVKNKQELQIKLRNKYKCVFIDEFQDTDHLQYDIFRKTFVDSGDTTVFFIGDPKQSIYSWRGADINTYIKAKDAIENHYTMKKNFRSTGDLVSAMNEFFPLGICDEKPESNPFCSEKITYEKVDAAKKDLMQLYKNSVPAHAFEILTFPSNNKNDHLFENTGLEVLDLVSNHYFLKNDEKRKVKPGNIGILVRTNKDAKDMKKILSRFNIPAIIIDETKVLETDEAIDLYYVIFAIINPNNFNVSRAILTSFTGYNTEIRIAQDMDYHKSLFLELQKTWKESGIYPAILSFIKRYNVRKNLLDSEIPNGSRIYTNLMQLTDILNEKEAYDNYGPEKLTDWFKKATEGLDTSSKYEQRLESDDDAVQISTIHKSKGLSYDIVLLPNANFTIKKESNLEKITLLKDNEFIISYYKTPEEMVEYEFQSEQENRRLLYVAITRAVYKCIINYNGKEGTLNKFIHSRDKNLFKYINVREPVMGIEGKYISENRKKNPNKRPLIFKGIIDNQWQLTSYSGLDTHNINIDRSKETEVNFITGYDKFIFNGLSKGTQTGLIIHKIFEKIDFRNDIYWNKIIENTLKYSGRNYSKDDLENYKQIIINTVKTQLLPANFMLSDVGKDYRFNELEFFFSYENWQGDAIKKILPEISISNRQIKGIMHGYIDLLFEYGGKYYILDWKTNYLGNTLENYKPQELDKAMIENNYYLQYYIYSIAIKRFLENRLKEFDYGHHFGGVFYLFIRGMRQGKDTGIYFKKPEKELILEIEQILAGTN